MDPIRRLPYGPAACYAPRQRPDTCQHPTARRTIPKILLAPEGASTHVHDDDIAGFEHGQELLLDIGAEASAVDRSVEDTRRGEPVAAQRAEEGQGAPMTMRGEAAQPLALWPPSPQRRHIGLDPGLVDEDQPPRVEPRLPGSPALAPARNVSAGLLKGEQGFF